MNIGIIVYSQSGNTDFVAGMLQEKLVQLGHEAAIEKIAIDGKIPAEAGKFTITKAPLVDQYDFVIIGSPVQAFSLNPAMAAYLENLSGLQGKDVALYVTKKLPISWAGGTQALKKMRKLCEAKGASVKAAEMVYWTEGKRDQMIAQVVETISGLV
ncbi:MAG: flavodoxin [Bacillota bacterium]